MSSRITHVLFDLYETLIPFLADDIVAGREELGAALGLSPGVLVRAYQELAGREIGAHGNHAGESAAVLRRAGLEPDPKLIDRLIANEAAARARVTLYPDVLPCLDALRTRGIGTAIVSNCTHMTRPLADELGLPDRVDQVLLSCEVGVVKPDPAIFRLAIERVGAVAEQTLFVDDTESFLDGAALVGLQTVQIDRKGIGKDGRHRTISSLDGLIDSVD